VPQEYTKGPWVDETDIRPTVMYLTGLKDAYEHDGRVITQILSHANSALRPAEVTTLGECYKQLNSSVGEFGTDTLAADTAAIDSTSTNDGTYLHMDQVLRGMDYARDALASQIKGQLEAAAFEDQPVRDASVLDFACQGMLTAAQQLAASSQHLSSTSHH